MIFTEKLKRAMQLGSRASQFRTSTDGGQRKAVPHGVYRGGGADPGQGIRGIQEDSDVSPAGRRETNQSDYF